MFNTVFDDQLGDFFYGDTCTENTFGYTRVEKAGTAFNFFSSGIRVPPLAIGVLLSTTILLLSTSSFGSSFQESIRTKKMYLSRGYSSGAPSKLDERGRLELVKSLLRIREDFKLSQEDLSKLLDVSKSTLSKLERGEHSPDATKLSKYKTFLELADYLQEKLSGKKFAIRQLFISKSPVFDGMNPIEFAHTIGEEGLNEVIYTFKRQYG